VNVYLNSRFIRRTLPDDTAILLQLISNQFQNKQPGISKTGNWVMR
jgi:hypothetical protein